MGLLDWRISVALLAIPLVGIAIVAGLVGRQIDREVSAEEERQQSRIKTSNAFTIAVICLVVLLPIGFLFWFNRWGDELLLSLIFTIVGWAFVALFFLVLLIGPKYVHKPMEKFVILLTLTIAISALYAAALSMISRHQNEQLFNQHDYFGPSRITGMIEANNDDDDQSNGLVYYTMQLEWPCHQETPLCTENMFVNCSNIQTGYSTNKWERMYYELLVKLNVYNVDNDEDCESIADAVVESVGNHDDDDPYVSPKKDGSPYVLIFGNCTDCSAAVASTWDARERMRPRAYGIQSIVYGCIALVSLVVTMLLQRTAANDKTVELIASDAEVA